MTTIEKAKDALIIHHNTLHLIIDILARHDPVSREFSVEFAKVDEKYSEALAALEAEKPAEDAIDVVERIYELYGDNWTKESIEVLQQYAEGYHERKMKEMTK